MKIQKGCRALGLRKGDEAHDVDVREVPGTGFRVTFEARGKRYALWATSRARVRPGHLSLNTGNPLNRVILVSA